MALKIYLAAAAVIASVAVGAPSPAASATSDKDAREISSYVLSEAGLAKVTEATQKLAAVPGACAEQDDDGSNSKSLDQMTAKLNSIPGAQVAIQSAGMTTREYVVFMWSMLENGMAAWAMSQPGGKLPPGTSPANVDFYKKHEAEMAALGENGPCDDDSADGEEDDT